MRRLVALVARFAGLLLFRRFEVAGRDHLPDGRPTLLVANHFNAFIDPVVISAGLGRVPRFIAKSSLGRIPVVGQVLRALGVVYIRRRTDEGGTGGVAGNADAFAACHRALAKRDTVAIFPEGTTHDRPKMDPIKTGAARIALGARAAGATGLVIVPAGLTFPDKVALRSAVLLQLGQPIELDELVPAGVGPDDADAVKALTAAIDDALREVSPDFPDVETALALEQAAHVALSDGQRSVPSLADREALARRLGRAPVAGQTAVRVAVGRYLTLLHGLRLTDGDLTRPAGPRRIVGSALGTALLVAGLGSLVVATAVINIVPALLVAAVSLLVAKPLAKTSIRALVGLVAFPAAWITAAVIAVDGPLKVSLVVLAAAVGALAGIVLVERAVILAHLLYRWQAQRERVATIGLAEEVRGEVADTVRQVVGIPLRAVGPPP